MVKIKGKVSVNNYLEIDGLWLTGRYMYLQLRLDGGEKDSVPIPPTCSPSSSPPILPPPLPTIATFHLIVVTTTNTTLRVTLSSLYDAPQFLGKSLSSIFYILCMLLHIAYLREYMFRHFISHINDYGMQNQNRGIIASSTSLSALIQRMVHLVS